MASKPWWWPTPVDDAYFSRLRAVYPDKAGWSDEELGEYFNATGARYAVTWDHVGDAYDEYEKVCDEMFRLLSLIERLEPGIDDYWRSQNDDAMVELSRVLEREVDRGSAE